MSCNLVNYDLRIINFLKLSIIFSLGNFKVQK